MTPHSISSAAPSAARTRYLTRILYYTNPPTTQIDHPRWEQSHTPKPRVRAPTRTSRYAIISNSPRPPRPPRTSGSPGKAWQCSATLRQQLRPHPGASEQHSTLSPTTPQALTQRSKKQPRACPEPGHPHQHQDPIVKAYLNDTPLIIGLATRLHYAGRVSIQRSERNIRVCATCD